MIKENSIHDKKNTKYSEKLKFCSGKVLKILKTSKNFKNCGKT